MISTNESTIEPINHSSNDKNSSNNNTNTTTTTTTTKVQPLPEEIINDTLDDKHTNATSNTYHSATNSNTTKTKSYNSNKNPEPHNSISNHEHKEANQEFLNQIVDQHLDSYKPEKITPEPVHHHKETNPINTEPSELPIHLKTTEQIRMIQEFFPADQPPPPKTNTATKKFIPINEEDAKLHSDYQYLSITHAPNNDYYKEGIVNQIARTVIGKPIEPLNNNKEPTVTDPNKNHYSDDDHSDTTNESQEIDFCTDCTRKIIDHINKQQATQSNNTGDKPKQPATTPDIHKHQNSNNTQEPNRSNNNPTEEKVTPAKSARATAAILRLQQSEKERNLRTLRYNRFIVNNDPSFSHYRVRANNANLDHQQHSIQVNTTNNTKDQIPHNSNQSNEISHTTENEQAQDKISEDEVFYAQHIMDSFLGNKADKD